MLSKKTLLIVGLILLITVNVIGLTLSSRQQASDYGAGRVGLVIVAPFQAAVTHSFRFVSSIWHHYFALASAARDNDLLRQALAQAEAQNDQFKETVQANQRLRNLLDFQQEVGIKVIPAEVIGKDPSPWFRSVIINKGRVSGVVKGQPVVTAQGIVGQVTEVAENYSKVMLIVNRILPPTRWCSAAGRGAWFPGPPTIDAFLSMFGDRTTCGWGMY